MSWFEFSIRISALLFGYSFIAYVVYADKPVTLIAPMIGIIIGAISADWTRLGTTTIVESSNETE